ncbi:MAG: hypothetical protein JXJ22_10755 [Bacteroidales bacterium]|nr:hypothetical protein [Bacteroidales bacterium]
MIKKIFFITLSGLSIIYSAYSQQNNVLFFMPAVPESNYVNPAIQPVCNFYIGLPVISSTHFNYGNTGFSYNQLFRIDPGSDIYYADINNLLKKLGNINYISTELHTNILALGYRYDEHYFTFSIQEKNSLAGSFTKDLISLIWNGNTPFEGQEASLKGSGILFNHYREYALGYSKNTRGENYFGVKGKLLFGKLNINTQRSDINLFTEPNTFDLALSADLRVNASLPVVLQSNANGIITDMTVDDSQSLQSLFFNRKNWGVAIDAGFIHEYNEKITLSGSILDLGFINWRDNVYNYTQQGDYTYTGPLGDSVITGDYFNEIRQAVADNFSGELTRNSYLFFLPVRMYLGGTYKFHKKLNFGVLYSNILYKHRLISGLTLSANATIVKNFQSSLSYSYINRSLNNVGVGLSIGRRPLQFYLVSDNILGIIWPQQTRNINLRFGMNIIFGCDRRNRSDGKGCYWIQKAEEKQARKRELLHK